MRKRMSSRQSKSTFRKGFNRQHKKNRQSQTNYWQRGGIRL